MSREPLIAMSAIISVVLLLACSESRNETAFIREVLSRKAGLHLCDTLVGLSIKDGGFDLHGTMAINYRLTISEKDLMNVISQIDNDSIHKWIQTDVGDYVTTIYPENYRDTVFGIGLIKSESIIDINMNQGF